MAVKTRAQLKSENASDFPDNTTKLISPADLRGQMDDVVDSALFPEDGVVAAAPGDVNGMVVLRGLSPISGSVIHLNYHTTVGDLGAGNFYGITGAAAGTYVDNGGTIVVPTGGDGSAAWLRVWDGVKAHVGWFGAKCTPLDTASDDYIPAQKCFNLFTDGRTSTRTGTVDVGPGFCFSQPLIYGGSNAESFKLVGIQAQARGAEGRRVSLLRYTGPSTIGAIIFYGANQWYIEDINSYHVNALNGIVITSDSTYNHTTTNSITAGSNRVVTPSGATAADRVGLLQVGCFLGVDAGGANFEIVYISAVDTTAGTFTANFGKNHASGVQIGGGAPSSSGRVNRSRIVCMASPVWTTLTFDPSIVSGSTRLFTVGDISGIEVGAPLRVGKYLYAEIVYPTVVNAGAGTFEATCIFDHLAGDLVMYPTSGILFGNRLTQTVQVDNIWMYDTVLAGADVDKSYAGIRQFYGGNVKAFVLHGMVGVYCRVPFAFESASGQYLISGGTSAGVTETLFLHGSGHLSVFAWEDESNAKWLVGQSGSNPAQATFVGCTMQGEGLAPTDDEMFTFGGNLTFIGCDLRHNRIPGTTLPKIVSIGVLQDAFPSSVTLIGCHIASATLANMAFILSSPGTPGDVIKTGTGKVTMLNCTGGVAGAGTIVRLPDVLPPLKMWEGSMVYDPASMAAGTVGPIVTLVPTPTTGGTVSGAVLGDVVDASFSLDLQGATLRAWVSATDTVKFQFAYPPGSTPTPLDLGSGTVKCRVKK
jgi:hypothetical protein